METTTRLTPEELIKARVMLASRVRSSWRGMIPGVLFLVMGTAYYLLASGKSLLLTVALLAAAWLVAGLVLWFLVWDLVRRIREDIENGEKATATGKLSAYEPTPTKYGDTPVLVDADRYVDLGGALTGMANGNRITVVHLPRSKVILVASRAQDE